MQDKSSFVTSLLQSPSDGTTTYTYDGVNGRGSTDANGQTQYGLLSTLTKGRGEYETYAYDTCNELTSIAYWWADGTLRNALAYTYDPAGNVRTANQGFYTSTFGYDGADQQTSESSQGTSFNVSLGYTYDKNGNRLTQSSGGTQTQSFAYDGHDKMTSGTAGSETPHYDLNGNEIGITINGGTWVDTWDEEDRLVKVVTPGGVTDTFTYNGLGLRVGKTDSTGTYSYVCDGTSPGSPILSDGHALYTPGLSENRGGTSLFYNSDDLGNLWSAEDGTGQAEAGAWLFTGFGAPLYSGSGGGSASPLKYGGANGCQTDYDTGLVLMGHRYYDVRTGRFISQDPAGVGNNWYSYADNNPVNAVDPTGLESLSFTVPANGNVDIQYTDEDTGKNYDTGVNYTNNTDQDIKLTINTDTMKSQTFNPSSNMTGPTLGQDMASGFGIGFAATGSALSFHMWDGGAARHDPSFGISRGFADVGVAAGSAAIPVGSLSAGARSVFYSGQDMLTAARAGKGMGKLLEDTIGGKFLNYVNSNIYQFPNKFWKVPSAIFALNAKGTATVFLNSPSAGSVWSTVEGPILKAMGTGINIK